MFQIIEKRKYAYVFSSVLITISIGAILLWGLKLGIDFKGGTLMEVRFPQQQKALVNNTVLEKVLTDVSVNNLTIQSTGDDTFILRYTSSDEEQNTKVLSALRKFDENVSQVLVDFVGATISDQLKRNTLVALILAIVAIMLYVAWAFRKVAYPVPSWHYGIDAIVALAHDIIITIGAFAIFGRFFGVDIGVSFIAAILTVLGYSVNDTIVVYDRVRENILRSRSVENFEEIVNVSLNETFSRSLNTSMAVVVVLIAIIAYGGPALMWFAVALLIGIVAGTYSSIFVATALLVTSYKWKVKGIHPGK